MTERFARSVLRVAGFTWLGSVVAGLILLQAHEMTPSDGANSSSKRPTESLLRLDPTRANLILVAHPRCPCTRASLGELARIVARCRNDVTVHVLFTTPGSARRADWIGTDLWRLAEEIPDVRIVLDEGGAEADRLGVVTSGQVLLHDATGRLLFSGGITGSRGHLGDNEGHDAVVALLKNQRPDRSITPVFGCPIISDRRKQGRPPSKT